MKAVRLHETGGPEVLRLVELPIPECADTQVRVRHEAIGINFIDICQRSGTFPLQLPSGLGIEAAGVVDAVGSGVTGFQPGERVAYLSAPEGSYSEYHVLDERLLVKLPDSIPANIAAASMVKGVTACYLLTRCYQAGEGSVILLHGAAGGVGSFMTQIAKLLGSTIIGVVSNPYKAKWARDNGCNHVVLYGSESISDEVMDFTDGRGADVVYDSVGDATFEESLKSLATRGLFVSIGHASGPLRTIRPAKLVAQGSIYFTLPSMFHYTQRRSDLVELTDQLFGYIGDRAIDVRIGHEYALDQIATAHADIEQRGTQGSQTIVL